MKIFAFLCWLSGAVAADLPASYRYQILISDPTSSSVTKESFTMIPHLVANLMKANVKVNTEWEKPHFTAWATPESINFWGGLARIPGMNDEAHALTACHELGHILGGELRIRIKDFLWSSAEGQSDYFATGICLKRYFSFLFDAGKLVVPENTNERDYTICRTRTILEKDFLICINSLKAITGFAKMLTHLAWYETTFSLEKKSSTRVKETLYNSYPDQQCRIDTLFNGVFCAPENFPCIGTSTFARPQCWFVR